MNQPGNFASFMARLGILFLFMFMIAPTTYADDTPVVCTQQAQDFLSDMETARDQLDGLRIMFRNMRDVVQGFIDDPNFESLSPSQKTEYRNYLQTLNETFTYLSGLRNKSINVINAMNADIASVCGGA